MCVEVHVAAADADVGDAEEDMVGGICCKSGDGKHCSGEAGFFGTV